MLMPPKVIRRAGDMVQWVKVLAAKPDDPSSSPGSTWCEGRADSFKLPLYSAHTLAGTKRNVLN